MWNKCSSITYFGHEFWAEPFNFGKQNTEKIPTVVAKSKKGPNFVAKKGYQLWFCTWLHKIIIKIAHQKFHLNLPGANELMLPKLLGQDDLTHLPLDKMAAILTDDIFKHIFFNENVRSSIQISLKFVPNGPINNKSALV